MTSRALMLMACAVLTAAVAGAQSSMTWNGAADGAEWYDFNAVDDTWDPQVWVNNWGQVYYRFPDDPAPTGMGTPTDTATIPLGFLAEIQNLVTVTTIELGGILEVRGQLGCAQVNVAGNLRMDHHGHVSGCTLQGDGPSGFLSSIAEVGSTLSGPTLDGVTLSLPTELGDDTRLGIAGVINNLNVIQLLDSPATGEARLVVDSDATLTGPGWVETSDSPDNTIGSRHNPHHRLTNQAEIHAAGLLGYNIAITNQDLIVADRATMLHLDPTDTPADGQPAVINQGTLRASDGGTLRLERGTFDNSAGVVEALDGSIVELGRATFLSGGELTTAGTGVIRSSHEHGNTTADPQVRDLLVSGVLQVPNARRLEIAGTIDLAGTIRLDASGTTAHLVVDSPTTLTGVGEVVMSDDSHNEIAWYNATGHRLTNDVTIRGAGEFQNIAVTNTGVIRAEGTTALVIDPWDTPVDAGVPFDNDGTLAAAAAGTLRLEAGLFDNAGGVVEAESGGVVELGVDGIVEGGTVRSLGTGVVRSTTSWHPPTIDAVSVEGVVEVPGSTDLVVRNGLALDGEIRLPGHGSVLAFTGPMTAAGQGGIVLADSGARVASTTPGQRLTSAVSIHGGGELGDNWLALTNNGVVTADDPLTPLVVRPSSATLDGQPGVINPGTLRAAGGATLRLYDGSFDGTGGVIEALDASVVELHTDCALTGGVLATSGSGVIRSTASWHPPSVTDATVTGMVQVPAGSHLWMAGTVTNHGMIEAEEYVRPSGDLVLDGSGELRLVDGGEIRPDGTNVTNGADHTISASGADQCWIHLPLTNLGTVRVAPGATLRFNDTYAPEPGSLTRIDGVLQPLGTLEMAGMLAGGGTVSGGVDVETTGVLAPGWMGPGTLTTGNLLVLDGAAYRWDISESIGTDLVDVAGELNLGASMLHVDLHVASGDVPHRVELFEYDSLASVPSMWQLTLSGGYTFTGIDTTGDRLALTGVANSDFIFSDDLENGDPAAWSSVVGAVTKSRRQPR